VQTNGCMCRTLEEVISWAKTEAEARTMIIAIMGRIIFIFWKVIFVFICLRD